jgi:1-acyl-sn-glycerol-3-phosphate acyltransferase
MSDAQVIPIGSGGRPGRGSRRRTTPSAAARSLVDPDTRKDRGGGPADAGETTDRPRSKGRRRAAGRSDPSRADAGRAEAGRAEAGQRDAEGNAAAAGPDRGIDASQFAAFEKIVRDTLGPDAERKVAEFLAFMRRRITGDYEIDEFGYDAELTDQILLPLMRPLAEKWFRVEVRGAENIPADGGALIVANHSGTLPLDGIVTHLVVRDHTGRPLRTLGADLVFKTPFVGELVRKGGGTLAGNDDAERLLGRGELVGVWPEGFKGIGKPFSERYKLQRFGRGGFVSAAMRTGVPIVPCSIVGAEEIYPLIGNIPSLARLLGVPYIPITPFFPLLGVLGMIPLPSKWLIEFGEPIRTDEFADGAPDDPMLVFNVTDQVRETIQQTLYSLLMQRRSVFF